jgi:hypothetical protein
MAAEEGKASAPSPEMFITNPTVANLRERTSIGGPQHPLPTEKLNI